jgi:hypothetical protein
LAVIYRMVLFEVAKTGELELINQTFHKLYPNLLTTNMENYGEDNLLSVYNLYH